MRYYDIHVQYGSKDGDGYSIPIAIEKGNENVAIKKAVKNGCFEYEEDVNDIDYIEEISKEEYYQMVKM